MIIYISTSIGIGKNMRQCTEWNNKTFAIAVKFSFLSMKKMIYIERKLRNVKLLHL